MSAFAVAYPGVIVAIAMVPVLARLIASRRHPPPGPDVFLMEPIILPASDDDGDTDIDVYPGRVPDGP